MIGTVKGELSGDWVPNEKYFNAVLYSGAGSGIIRTFEQLVRGVWVPMNNEILRPTLWAIYLCLIAVLPFKNIGTWFQLHESMHSGQHCVCDREAVGPDFGAARPRLFRCGRLFRLLQAQLAAAGHPRPVHAVREPLLRPVHGRNLGRVEVSRHKLDFCRIWSALRVNASRALAASHERRTAAAQGQQAAVGEQQQPSNLGQQSAKEGKKDIWALLSRICLLVLLVWLIFINQSVLTSLAIVFDVFRDLIVHNSCLKRVALWVCVLIILVLLFIPIVLCAWFTSSIFFIFYRFAWIQFCVCVPTFIAYFWVHMFI